jgi:hypothetical protein
MTSCGHLRGLIWARQDAPQARMAAISPQTPRICITRFRLIRDLNKSRFQLRPGVSRIALRDRRHRLPHVVDQPKILTIVAKRVKIAGISGDLNNGPCHAISFWAMSQPEV